MATAEIGSILVNVLANTATFARDMKSANQKLDSFGKVAKRTTQLVGGLFAGIQVGRVISDISKTSDNMLRLDSRLRLVTKSSGEFKKVSQDLSKVANASNADIEETTTLYTKLARSTKSLGTDQQTLLKTTEIINKALAISGASAVETSASLRQLGQGLASGVLRGDELNSVLEQTPRLAEAIADGLGITIGQLRKYGEQGRLTSESVIQALASQADKINEEFSSVPVTIDVAFTKMKNSYKKGTAIFAEFNRIVSKNIEFVTMLIDKFNSFIGTSDKAASTQQTVADQINQVSKRIKELTDRQAFQLKAREAIISIIGKESQSYERNTAEIVETSRAINELTKRLQTLKAQAKKGEAGAAVIDPTTIKEFYSEAERADQQIKELNKSFNAGKASVAAYEEGIRKVAVAYGELNTMSELDKAKLKKLDQSETLLSNALGSSAHAELEADRTVVIAAEATEKLKQLAMEYRETWNEVGRSMAKGIGDAFADAVFEGQKFADSMRILGKQIIKELISSLVQLGIARATFTAQAMAEENVATANTVSNQAAIASAAAPAAAATSLSSYGSNSIPAIAGILAVFGLMYAISKRAGGGPLGQGQASIVGEHGPELFIPQMAGNVVPSSQLGGGGTTVYYTRISAIDSKSFGDALKRNGATVNQVVVRQNNERGNTTTYRRR